MSKNTSKVYFIGAGPGDVDLITVKGRDILAKADVVIYAGSLVSKEHLDFCKKDVEKYNSASMTLEDV
ncbi:cobalt-precorrin-4 C(11)-methyltransferase, partial [Bacteroidales bacterium MSK.15.36]|nr:cobalt-precorrin-4 C(11)-methyltransferase [Bacteroidales bacterium MSK.15.36]